MAAAISLGVELPGGVSAAFLRLKGEADLFPLISDNPPRELCTWD